VRALSVPSLWIVSGRHINVQDLARAFGCFSISHKVAGFVGSSASLCSFVLILRYAHVSDTCM
jgi:hypothetical protein